MGPALLFCAVLAGFLPFQISHAADADANDIVIVSVKPRSPDVKPIAVAISAKGQETSLPRRQPTGHAVSRPGFSQ